ncbi:MAG: sigma-70 family RNA polymerase sigma factor [Kiritimatiellae bacterium]|nr:sigma-70 family RNA polymerase sigma factor [Kiritimatiellia bacterium]
MKWYNFTDMIPVTSITLLKDLASGAAGARWTEFYRVYGEPMRAFLRIKFPSVDPDDAIQETMAALAQALPDYRYTPDEKRHFRNYLMGILKHKAADLLKRQVRESNARAALRGDDASAISEEDEEWKFAAMESAVEQLMADPSINPRTREIFRHVALLHKSAADVARLFGVSRNNVDQIKNRLIRRLSEMVAAMTAAV